MERLPKKIRDGGILKRAMAEVKAEELDIEVYQDEGRLSKTMLYRALRLKGYHWDERYGIWSKLVRPKRSGRP